MDPEREEEKRPEQGTRAVWRGPWYLTLRKRLKMLVLATEQITDLVVANAPLAPGLAALAVDAPHRSLHYLFMAMRSDIVSGAPLHEAMAERPNFFPRYYVDLVRNGEQTGRLPETLLELENELIGKMVFRDRIRAYLYYILGVLGFDLFIAAAIVVFVVPQFEQMFASMGSQLPAATQWLIRVSNFVRSWRGLLCFLAILCPFVFALRGSVNGESRWSLSRLSRLLSALPGVRSVVLKRDLAHACSALQTLLAGGVPMNETLDAVASMDLQPRLLNAFRRMKDRVEQGASLREAMAPETSSLPASFRGLVALGESSGRVPEALGRLAEFYQKSALSTAKILLDITTPVAVILVGLFVFFIHFGLFSAVFQLPLLGMSR